MRNPELMPLLFQSLCRIKSSFTAPCAAFRLGMRFDRWLLQTLCLIFAKD